MAPHHHRRAINFYCLLGSRSFSNLGKSEGQFTHSPGMVKAIESGLVTKEEADKIVSDLRKDLYPLYSYCQRGFLDDRRSWLEDEIKEVKSHKDIDHLERVIFWRMFKMMDKEKTEHIKEVVDELRALDALRAAVQYDVMKTIGIVVSVCAIIGIAVIYNITK